MVLGFASYQPSELSLSLINMFIGYSTELTLSKGAADKAKPRLEDFRRNYLLSEVKVLYLSASARQCCT